MIKPATLWSLFKTCENSQWLGDLCRALGGQQVSLDYGQKQMLTTVQMDSGWMDERMEQQRERWRNRQREKRERLTGSCEQVRDIRDNGDMSQCHACHDTSIRPSIHPIPKGIEEEKEEKEEEFRFPTPDEQRMFALQLNVPVDYIATFNERIRAIGYQYINRNGKTININRRNWKTCLRTFYATSQKQSQSQIPVGMIHQQEGYNARKLGI